MAQATPDGDTTRSSNQNHSQNPKQSDADRSNDFSAFEGTRPVAERQRFDTAALAAWLAAHVKGFEGPLTVEQFAGGQSNPTFKLVTPSRSYVMRAKPGPKAKLLPSAHAIEREYRVMDALGATDVPVARMLALCEDEAVIGRAFYVMEFVEGRVLWDQSLPGMTREERGAIYDEMNRVIAALHNVDPNAIGLADYGKPGNYFARQIDRWSRQYQASETESIEAMNRLIEWLPKHVPDESRESSEGSARVSIVHGDFRLDNLIFHPTEPRVLAVLDWELSTLGNPLADFSYHCMAWHVEPGQFRGIGGLDWAALGIPDEQAYVRRYCERTGLTIHGDWNFYLAYNMFRIAAILQGIMKRVVDGTAASAQAADAGRRAKPMAELAWHYAQKVR
ncbi:phosphotransferase family protein [Paraburkholderia bannensis]|uniref:phosphotransferase family protein n=1 Tax=Paraburkholderia bannensis TaxID=765414 RepID=UPI002ABDBCDF|nr:phosphotransferase family protein [Paraburkholderia bannensis]